MIKVKSPTHVEIDGQLAGKVVDVMVNHKHLASDVQIAFESFHAETLKAQADQQKQIDEHKAALTKEFREVHEARVKEETAAQVKEVTERANGEIQRITKQHEEALKLHAEKDAKIKELEGHVRTLGGRKMALETRKKQLDAEQKAVEKELANAR